MEPQSRAPANNVRYSVFTISSKVTRSTKGQENVTHDKKSSSKQMGVMFTEIAVRRPLKMLFLIKGTGTLGKAVKIAFSEL